MNKRYVVVDGSESGHCCFDASVLDTHNPDTHIHKNGTIVCECFERDDADRIAAALEVAHEASGGEQK